MRRMGVEMREAGAVTCVRLRGMANAAERVSNVECWIIDQTTMHLGEGEVMMLTARAAAA